MKNKIGLALSGGGVRAMVFHAGVLQWLATRGLLEQVASISSVSGGTLVTGLIYALNGWRWPSSTQYLQAVWPELRRLLTSVCLQTQARTLLVSRPGNWRYIFSRANVLALAIQQSWNIEVTLNEIDASVDWSINGTTAETGRRFRFKRGRCGDYEIGYAASEGFSLAGAMAASAAYPLLIGPLRIDATAMEWFRRPAWGDAPNDEKSVSLPYKTLHIIDGGVYDNLGMEPLFDTGEQRLKGAIDHLIVSDAGAAFERAALPAQWRVRRLARILEISMDQTRALRVRPWVQAILREPTLGRYYQIGSDPSKKLAQYGGGITAVGQSWLSASEIAHACSWPTDLKQVTRDVFDLISRHGHETAAWNDMLFSTRSE